MSSMSYTPRVRPPGSPILWNCPAVNSYDISVSDQTITTADMLVNRLVEIGTGNPDQSYALVTPTAAALVLAARELDPSVRVGDTFMFSISMCDGGAGKAYLSGGSGVTVKGGLTPGAFYSDSVFFYDVSRTFFGTFDNVTASTEAITIR